MTTQETLSDLLEIYASAHPTRTELYTDVAERLSNVARKEPAWGADYIQAVASGKLPASKRLARAVDLLAAEVDGTPVEISDTESVTVFARPGTIQPGALLVGISRPCAYDPCPLHFVVTHPRQKYCPLHRDPKSRH